MVNQRKQKVASNPGTAHSPEIQSNRMWWGAASPILNDTPVVCIYTSYNWTHIENAHLFIYIYILTHSFWAETRVIRRKHIIKPSGLGACSSTCCQWDGEDVPASWEPSNSHPPFRVQNHVSIHSCSITYAVEEFLLSIIPNSVIAWSLQYNVFFATIDRCSIMTGMHWRSMMVYSSP